MMVLFNDVILPDLGVIILGLYTLQKSTFLILPDYLITP